MSIKGCQTVAQYKIMRWVEETFMPKSVKVCFVGKNEAILTDCTDARGKLIYVENEVRLEELE